VLMFFVALLFGLVVVRRGAKEPASSEPPAATPSVAG
jgi:hypothetical protein